MAREMLPELSAGAYRQLLRETRKGKLISTSRQRLQACVQASRGDLLVRSDAALWRLVESVEGLRAVQQRDALIQAAAYSQTLPSTGGDPSSKARS
jgi:hypothetical protein